VAIPSSLGGKHGSIRERLLEAGFQEEFIGDHLPPATGLSLDGLGGVLCGVPESFAGQRVRPEGKKESYRFGGGDFLAATPLRRDFADRAVERDVKHRERVSVPEIDESAGSQRSQFFWRKNSSSMRRGRRGIARKTSYTPTTRLKYFRRISKNSVTFI
jgi:hypothetical protein